MNKRSRLLTVILLLSGITDSISVYCQKFYLSDGVSRVITAHCPVCKKNPAPGGTLISLQNGIPGTGTVYHNALGLLKQGYTDSSYQYLSMYTSAEPGKEDTLFNITAFLRAKILFYKSLYEEALEIYLSLLSKKKLDEVIKENICTNVAEIHLEQSRFKEALAFFTLWQSDYKQVSNANSIKSVYCNIGLCYLHTKNFEKAGQYFEKSIVLAKQLKDTSGLAILYENIANQYYNQYLDDKALPYFLQALVFAKRAGNTKAQMNIYGSLSVVEENRSHFSRSLNYLKNYVSLNDSLFKRDDIYNLIQKEKLQAIKEKEHRIKIAEQENRLQVLKLAENDLKLSKQKQLLYLSVIIAATFLSFFIFAFFAYRQKNRQNKIIAAQRKELDVLNHTKDQLFSIVAHDLRSPVQSLKLILIKLRAALADKNIAQAEQVTDNIENISNSTYSLVNNLLYWALSQTGQLHFANDKLDLKRLVDQVLYDYKPVADGKNITLENQVHESLCCRGDMNTVKIILRNLIDNAIKFSEPFSQVIISGTEEAKECIISVTDFGKGIDAAIISALDNNKSPRVAVARTETHSTGIGLWLVKTMAEKNGGSFRIVREPRGTRMNIHLLKQRNHEQAQNTYSRG